MSRDKIDIKTQDGVCPTSIFRPQAGGPWPGVIMYMDGPGIRPALFEMGERLAGHGYYVILPDLFYRMGPYEPVNPRVLFADKEKLAAWRASHMSTASRANVRRDSAAFLDHLSAARDVVQSKFGTTGYCMGGGHSLVAAGAYPDRIAAAAAYHPARLATDEPDSPHLLAPQIKAKIYVAAAADDEYFPDDMKQRFEAALTAAHVDHRVETYSARHGFVPSDTIAHDATAAERHWKTLLELFDGVLKAKR